MIDTTRFLLADDHSLIRQGVEFLIEDLEIDSEVFHASSLSKVLEIIQSEAIDILVIDAHFPDGNSLTIIPEVRKTIPRIKILVFTGLEENTQALKFLQAGANGFISKLSEEEEIKVAINSIYEEGEYISKVVRDLMLQSIQNPTQFNPLNLLSARELEVVDLYCKGFGNLEIANELDVKQNTVSTMKKRIFDKLDISNVLELVELVKTHK
jgi:DNA-binding NarL/FixJ family response regulator